MISMGVYFRNLILNILIPLAYRVGLPSPLPLEGEGGGEGEGEGVAPYPYTVQGVRLASYFHAAENL